MMGRSRDVRGTSDKPVFINSTDKHIKFTLTGYSRLKANGSDEKFCKLNSG